MRPNEVRVVWYSPDSNLAVYCSCGAKLAHLQGKDSLENMITFFSRHLADCPHKEKEAVAMRDILRPAVSVDNGRDHEASSGSARKDANREG